MRLQPKRLDDLAWTIKQVASNAEALPADAAREALTRVNQLINHSKDWKKHEWEYELMRLETINPSRIR